MIKIDHQNSIFASEVRAALRFRGLDSYLANDLDCPTNDGSEEIFVSCVSADFNLPDNAEFISFLKENKFKKSVVTKFSSSEFKCEEFLNGAISVYNLPVELDSKGLEKDFYMHYMLETVLKNYPNLPANDDRSSKLAAVIKKIADTDATVLINGPTGTGKEVVSNLIHNFSSRAEKALVAVNCAAIPDQMLESML